MLTHTLSHTYIHINTYTHTHAYIYIHTIHPPISFSGIIHTYTHHYIHTPSQNLTYIHIYIHTCIHSHCTHASAHAPQVSWATHTHIYTSIHTYIHIHTYMYIHTLTLSSCFCTCPSGIIATLQLPLSRTCRPM